MKFVFFDKIKTEFNIITDILNQENIPYKIQKKLVNNFFLDDDDEDFVIVEELYDIHCFTDLKHFEFVKHIADKKIENRLNLERCFWKKARRKKNVQRISKKNITNTNRKNRDK